LSHARGNALILHPHTVSEAQELGYYVRVATVVNDPRFITHLIATREQVPQTRPKRKAAPDQGAAAYRISGAIDIPAEPHRVRRTI